MQEAAVPQEARPWIVRSLWVGPPLTQLEWVSLASFVRHGARFELFTDDLSRKVPAGVVLRDSRELLGSTVPRYGPRAGSGAGSYALAGNVARLTCLLRHGGWWVDTDVVCLRPFTSIEQEICAGWEVQGHTANVAVIRMPPGHAATRSLLRRAKYSWFGSPWESWWQRLRFLLRNPGTLINPYNVPWGSSSGPGALTACLDYYHLRQYIVDVPWFYPIRWQDWAQVLTLTTEQFESLRGNSYALHLWSEMYRRGGVDKNRAFSATPWAQQYLQDWPG